MTKPPYRVRQHRLFGKEVLKVPKHHQAKLYKRIYSLSQEPQKLPPNTTLLSGYQQIYRTRFGDFRLIFHINHKEKLVTILGVGSRGGVYQLLRRLLD